MKKVEAIVRPHTLDAIHTNLHEEGFAGLTVSEVRGYGRQKGHKEMYRGSEYNIEFTPKIKVELVCSDERVEKAVEIIIRTARTGQVGDGKIFIYPVEETIRIRTEESGQDAL